ncbi:glycosyltransferase [Rhodopseudomonas palustris]|nr:glycosyltransferase [Rhodopseudomonas palustris]
MNMLLKVLVVSDVSLGYGTPQILRLANSIAERIPSSVLVLEPDQPERPKPSEKLGPQNLIIRRIYTATHPYSGAGLIEYVLAAKSVVEDFDADIFIGASHAGVRVAAISNLGDRSVNMLYCLEDAGSPLFDDCTIPTAAGKWDIVAFPEENRAKKYHAELGLSRPTDTIVAYNANSKKRTVQLASRNGRVFYGGLVSEKTTLAKYFAKIADFPIDVFGNIDGLGSKDAFLKHFTVPGGITYKGYFKADDKFFETLSQYVYSIVGWMPVRFDFLNAAPNKFFDAVACGVPPICAPHPQCVELIEKWHCGLLMDDWSFASFKSTVEKALQIAGTDYYAELVHNCQRAMEEELSWDRQFDKLLPLIERHLAKKGRTSVR